VRALPVEVILFIFYFFGGPLIAVFAFLACVWLGLLLIDRMIAKFGAARSREPSPDTADHSGSDKANVNT
jgi:predicted lipid-binding transport protein (Tim44 family)